MALTDIIEQDLLATLDGETDPQAVLDRYSSSKGPLYAALARATAQATERFRETRDKLRALEARRKAATDRAATEEERAKKAERRVADTEKRLTAATGAFVQQQMLLDRAHALRDAGFDDDSLATLGRAFAQVASTEGTTPADAAARFVRAATDFEGIAGFERQAWESEARAKKVEAEAQQREYKAKVRKVAVDWAEWFVRQGITVETVGAWRSAGEKLGLTAENLARCLADALRQFGSLDAACQARAKERDALARGIGQKRATVAKLKAENENITATLDAVAKHGSSQVVSARTAAVAAVNAVRDEAIATLRETEEQYARIKAEAAAVEPAVRFAQALANPHEMLWLDVTPEQWGGLLRQFGRYLATRGNPEAPAPEQASKQLKDRISYSTVYGRPRLGELVDWLILGLYRPTRDRENLVPVERRHPGDGRH